MGNEKKKKQLLSPIFYKVNYNHLKMLEIL